MPPGLNIVPNGQQSSDPSRASYQPVPDNRFYTKANFFTLRNNSRENVISEQYQTDAEPGEQEVFEEMMHRRNKLAAGGVVQAPAVPGDSSFMRSPQQANMNRTINSQTQYNTDVKNPNRQLQTISETNPQANNSFYDNSLVYPQPAPKQ